MESNCCSGDELVSKLRKKALLLSVFTVVYNIVEGIISIVAGFLSGSVALVGFGLDSFVESLSGGVMIWRFRNCGKMSSEEEARVDKKAVKLVGWTFFALAAYIGYESVTKLYFQEIPQPSLLGIIVASASLIIMPVLFYLKYRISRLINSKSLMVDSKQTLACSFLSVALLVGLGMNYLYGFWQADPVVGLIIVAFLIKEGYSALKEGKLCSC
ncbi:MAG: cation transporter [Planctomycetes bacterium]|nr:cation transporter [Planctomycetota bacterium]